MAENYIDNATRKALVTFWIKVCLTFLHLWASVCVIAMICGIDNDTIRIMFQVCGGGIFGMILLLVSDKFLELILAKFTSAVAVPAAQKIEETTTKTTIVTPAAPVDPATVSNVDIKADNVNLQHS